MTRNYSATPLSRSYDETATRPTVSLLKITSGTISTRWLEMALNLQWKILQIFACFSAVARASLREPCAGPTFGSKALRSYVPVIASNEPGCANARLSEKNSTYCIQCQRMIVHKDGEQPTLAPRRAHP